MSSDKLEIDTNRFIVCGECSNANHFGRVTITKARRVAKKAGWIMRDGQPLCQECQDRLRREVE